MATYTPQSPRASATMLMRPGIFGKKKTVKPSSEVPPYLKELLKVKSSKPQKKFEPVLYWQVYLKDLERTGTDSSVIDQLRRDHEEWEAKQSDTDTASTKEVVSVPDRVDAVVVNTTVSKSGKVKVSMGAPMEAVYTKYFSKGVRPPIGEYLKALKKFGYPESVLMKVLDTHQRVEAKSAEMDTFIEAIFGKGGGKASKPKAKSNRDRLFTMLKMKKPKAPKPEEDTADDDNEDEA